MRRSHFLQFDDGSDDDTDVPAKPVAAGWPVSITTRRRVCIVSVSVTSPLTCPQRPQSLHARNDSSSPSQPQVFTRLTRQSGLAVCIRLLVAEEAKLARKNAADQITLEAAWAAVKK